MFVKLLASEKIFPKKLIKSYFKKTLNFYLVFLFQKFML